VALVTACTGPGHVEDAAPGSASTTASSTAGGLALAVPRAVHRATALDDGRILVTGGCTLPGCDGFDRGQGSEIFDPRSGQFAAGPEMTEPRAGHTATLLPDGRVLIVGGYPGEGRAPLATAEVFDPTQDRLVPVGDLAGGRADHSATVLADGLVLIAGGTAEGGSLLATTELFDPRTGRFRPGPALSAPRTGHAAVGTGGRLVLIGGTTDGEHAVPTTDVLIDGAFAAGPMLREPRIKHAASVLPDRTVLVVGGASTTEGRDLLATTEILDLGAGRSGPGPALSEGQYKLDGAVVSLPDGRVVIAGGSRVNVYDPATGAMVVLDAPPVPRRSFLSASPLNGTEVLVAGGYDGDVVPTADARIVRIPPTR
jgi:hypothetical protein